MGDQARAKIMERGRVKGGDVTRTRQGASLVVIIDTKDEIVRMI
jgi:hypothetical protein